MFSSSGWIAVATMATLVTHPVTAQVTSRDLSRHAVALKRISGLGLISGRKVALNVSKVDGSFYAYLMSFPGRGSELLAQVKLGAAGSGRLTFYVETSPLGTLLAVLENEKTPAMRTRFIRLHVSEKDGKYTIEHSSSALVGRRITAGTCNLNEKYIYALDFEGYRVLGWAANKLPTSSLIRELPWEPKSRIEFVKRGQRNGFQLNSPPSLDRGFELASGLLGKSTYVMTERGLMVSSAVEKPRTVAPYQLAPRGYAVDQLGIPWRAEASLRVSADRRVMLRYPDRTEIVMSTGKGAASAQVELGGKLESKLSGKVGCHLTIGKDEPRLVILRLRYGERFSQIPGVGFVHLSVDPLRLVMGRKGQYGLLARILNPEQIELDGFLLLSWRDIDDKDHLLRSKSGKVLLNPRVVHRIAMKQNARSRGNGSLIRRRVESQTPYTAESVSGVMLSQFVLVDRKTGKLCVSEIRASVVQTPVSDPRAPRLVKLVAGEPWSSRSTEYKGEALMALKSIWSSPAMLGKASVDELKKLLLSQ